MRIRQRISSPDTSVYVLMYMRMYVCFCVHDLQDHANLRSGWFSPTGPRGALSRIIFLTFSTSFDINDGGTTGSSIACKVLNLVKHVRTHRLLYARYAACSRLRDPPRQFRRRYGHLDLRNPIRTNGRPSNITFVHSVTSYW
jgi:hypothetical protein